MEYGQWLLMVYYLNHAPYNKTTMKELNFTTQQLNMVATLMLQCRPLRQRDPIINLLRASLPENFEMELLVKENEDKTRSWKEPLIVEAK